MKKLYLLSTLMLFVIAAMLPKSMKAQLVETHVTSFGTYNFSGKHFCILSNMENISSDDVEFKEYAKYISYAFQMRGGIEVSPQSKEVEVCILLSYDIKDASYVRTISEPIWGRTDIKSISATTNSLGTNYDFHYNRGVVGYRQSEQKVDKYIRYIDVFAYEIFKGNGVEQKMVWKAYAKSEGNINNLFKVFPCMALTLYKNIGSSTDDDWARFSTEIWAVKNFKQGKYNLKNRTFLPLVESGRSFTSYTLGKVVYYIWQIRQEPDFTRIILQVDDSKSNKMKCCIFYDNTFIKYKDQKLKWKDAFFINNQTGARTRDVTIGKPNFVFNDENFLCIDFPALPDDVLVFDLITQKKEGKSSKEDMIWKGIHLRNW